MKPITHKFQLGDENVELEISKNNIWKAKVLKGTTGTGTISGGNHNSMDSFIASVEKQHRATHKSLPKVEKIVEKAVKKVRGKKG